MGLDQLKMAPLVPDDSLQRFPVSRALRCKTRRNLFSSGICAAIKCRVYIWWSL